MVYNLRAVIIENLGTAPEALKKLKKLILEKPTGASIALLAPPLKYNFDNGIHKQQISSTERPWT
jgi:hypothetical protein